MSALMQFGNTNDFGQSSGVERIDTAAIRELQKQLGVESCFRTAKSFDCTTDCGWRRHCTRPIAEWLRDW